MFGGWHLILKPGFEAVDDPRDDRLGGGPPHDRGDAVFAVA
jgi:hypothetical protein